MSQIQKPTLDDLLNDAESDRRSRRDNLIELRNKDLLKLSKTRKSEIANIEASFEDAKDTIHNNYINSKKKLDVTHDQKVADILHKTRDAE